MGNDAGELSIGQVGGNTKEISEGSMLKRSEVTANFLLIWKLS